MMQLATLTRLAIALGMAATLCVGVSGSTLVATTPEQAIANAVAERMGGGVSVRVSDIDTTVAGQSGLQAQLDPAARLGQPTRFVLTSNGVRKGAAVATVHVEGPFA